MDLDLKKFYIGVVDFFAVIMPGALLTFLLKDWVASTVFGLNGFKLVDTESWIIFLFASYLLGHFVFVLGSALIDDYVYDPFRSCTDRGQFKRLAECKGLDWRFFRWLAATRFFFGGNADGAVMQAEQIKVRTLQVISAERAINAFQWCKALLSRIHPEGLAVVQRFEADSKFFRSFIVVLFVVGLLLLFQGRVELALVCPVFILLSLWRYIEQRFKATQQAYYFVIMLEARKCAASTTTPPYLQKPDGLMHAVSVVYRDRHGVIEYLLLENKDRSKWVFPEGEIQPGDIQRETAVRIVRKETNHWAKVVRFIPEDKLISPTALCYLMEAVDHDNDDDQDDENQGRVSNKKYWPAENRQHAWLVLAEAKNRAGNDTDRVLLELADKLRRADNKKAG